MKSRGFRRRFVFLCSTVLLALPLQATTTRELDPLAKELASYLAGAAPDGPTGLKLAMHLVWSERTALFEPDPAKKAALLERLAILRHDLEGVAGRGGAEAAGGNGAFSGRITDDGAPLEAAYVRVFTLEGYWAASTQTGPDGRYSLSVEPGTYRLYVEPPYGSQLSPQLYEGISCVLSVTCQIGDGRALTLASGGHIAADFTLEDFGRIEGRVRHHDTMEPIATEIRIFTREGSYLRNEWSYGGVYQLGGLVPGDYWVVASPTGELTGMIYDGVPCNSQAYSFPLTCSLVGATSVRIELDQVVTGIDFDLYRGGVLTGRALDSRTGAPVEYPGEVRVWDAATELLTRAYYVGYDGEYRIEGLAPGNYYASIDGGPLTPQFFDRYDCISGKLCFAGAQPIAVSLGLVHGPLDFVLRQRGTVSGRIRDDRTGAGVEGAAISLIDPLTGSVYLQRGSDSAGFFSFSEVPAVKIQLLVSHQGYLDEYFDDVDARQGPAAAKILEIQPSEVTSVEVGLTPRGTVTAQIVDAESGLPVECAPLRAVLVDGSGNGLDLTCSADGRKHLRNLLPGLYYVMAGGGGWEWASYLYGRGSCTPSSETSFCNVRRGTLVEVRSGETIDLGTFRLERGGRIRWILRFENGEGAPNPSARLRLYDSDGDEVRSLIASGANDFNGLAPGNYRLVVDGSPTWESLAYPDASCGRWYCDPSRGEEIVVPPGFNGPWITVELDPIAPYARCTPSESSLCLNQGRYRVSATWHDFAGASGAGTARGLTADSGYFYFFSPNNLEVLVKVLNGCAPHLGHHFWVYGAGLTNVQVQLRVEDTLTGAVELYSNALGSTFQPILDNAAFATCDAVAPQSGLAGSAAPGSAAANPVADPALSTAAVAGVEACSDNEDFCLGGRFAVEATYRASGTTGQGGGTRVTPDTGTFYFFDVTNVELVVKILDACNSALPGYWVFASGLTDVEVDLEITDKATGRSKFYHQPPGPFVPIIDLQSFPCQ